MFPADRTLMNTRTSGRDRILSLDEEAREPSGGLQTPEHPEAQHTAQEGSLQRPLYGTCFTVNKHPSSLLKQRHPRNAESSKGDIKETCLTERFE